MPNTTISKLTGRQVWDSRGRPTVEAEVRLVGGSIGRAIAPAGASRGSHEAVDLRDGGRKFGGMGVSSAVANINGEISGLLTGRNSENQSEIDDALIRLDGTENKMRLGGNATIAVSMAVLHAAAGAKRTTVPFDLSSEGGWPKLGKFRSFHSSKATFTAIEVRG